MLLPPSAKPITQPTAYDDTFVSRQNVSYQPSGNPNATTQIRIDMKDVGAYILMSESFLEVRFKITAPDLVTPLLPGALVSLRSGWALFDSLMLSINTASKQTLLNPSWLKNVENQLYSKDYVETTGSLEFDYPDSGTYDAVIATNPGFAIRRAETDNGRIASAELKLSSVFGVLKNNYVSTGNGWSLSLNRASLAEQILSDGTAAAVVITHLNWVVPHVTLGAKALLSYNKSLLSDTKAKWGFYEKTITSQSFSAATLAPRVIVQNPTGFVNKIIVFVQLATQDTSSLLSNHNYYSTNITSVYARRNGKFYPFERYTELDFSGNGVDNRVYKAYLQFGGALWDTSSGVYNNKIEFGANKAIFCIDMQDEKLPGDKLGTSDVIVEMTMSGALPGDYNVKVLSFTEKEMLVEGNPSTGGLRLTI